MPAQGITDETRVTMLLCCHFSKAADDATDPLRPQEFDALLTTLKEKGGALPVLLADGPGEWLDGSRLDTNRIAALLHREATLASNLDRWQSLGIWVLTRLDPDYPSRVSRRLGASSFPILYGVGDPRLLEAGGLAIIGSREVSEQDVAFTEALGAACAGHGIPVVSGGARGIDQSAMQGALFGGGRVLGVLVGDLAKSASGQIAREAIEDNQLVLATPYHPEGGFDVGKAMGRNKLVYTLSDWAVVVRSSEGSGGTWTGAVENLKHGWVPLFVCGGDGIPDGNTALIGKGAIELAPEAALAADDLGGYLDSQAAGCRSDAGGNSRDEAGPAQQQLSFD